jgi:hypothetical protein
MSRQTWRSSRRVQLGAGRGAIFQTAPRSTCGSLTEVSATSYSRAHLQTARGYETGPIAFCSNICKYCNENHDVRKPKMLVMLFWILPTISLPPTLIPLSGVGTTCFHHVIKIRQLFLQPAWRQPSLKLEWVLTIANATGTNGLTCLPKHGYTANYF